MAGQRGGPSVIFSGAGYGGDSILGNGGPATAAQAAGLSGSNYGAGAGGAYVGAGGNNAGAAGTAGVVIFEW
jgi:hypothetical protein